MNTPTVQITSINDGEIVKLYVMILLQMLIRSFGQFGRFSKENCLTLADQRASQRDLFSHDHMNRDFKKTNNGTIF